MLSDNNNKAKGVHAQVYDFLTRLPSFLSGESVACSFLKESREEESLRRGHRFSQTVPRKIPRRPIISGH